MEATSRNFKQNFFDRAKSFFHHLRWFFCLSTPEESKDAPNKIGKGDNLQLQFVNKHYKSNSFVDLPTECKLKIFSFLTAQEKGSARLVCLEWRDLLKACVLWQDVDLTSIKLICKCLQDHCNSMVCYEDYKTRMRKFVDFIAIMQPHVKSLKFSFDMIDCDDGWLDMLQSFLDSVHVNDMHTAEINWMSTPEKPGVDSSEFSENMSDLLLKQRRRHRRFESFFDFFTQLSFRLKHLTLPFEWTEKSLHLLCRLKQLEVLVLHQCTDNHSKLEQKSLNQLLQALPYLKHLTIGATFGDTFVLDHLFPSSKSLRSLNLENCKGVTFTGFDLQSLVEIHIGKKQKRENFIEQNFASLPCLHNLLADGAPKLRLLNGYYLQDDWKGNIREEVGAILGATCSCPVHGANP